MELTPCADDDNLEVRVPVMLKMVLTFNTSGLRLASCGSCQAELRILFASDADFCLSWPRLTPIVALTVPVGLSDGCLIPSLSNLPSFVCKLGTDSGGVGV